MKRQTPLLARWFWLLALCNVVVVIRVASGSADHHLNKIMSPQGVDTLHDGVKALPTDQIQIKPPAVHDGNSVFDMYPPNLPIREK